MYICLKIKHNCFNFIYDNSKLMLIGAIKYRCNCIDKMFIFSTHYINLAGTHIIFWILCVNDLLSPVPFPKLPRTSPYFPLLDLSFNPGLPSPFPHRPSSFSLPSQALLLLPSLTGPLTSPFPHRPSYFSLPSQALFLLPSLTSPLPSSLTPFALLNSTLC